MSTTVQSGAIQWGFSRFAATGFGNLLSYFACCRSALESTTFEPTMLEPTMLEPTMLESNTLVDNILDENPSDEYDGKPHWPLVCFVQIILV